jgi:hypothetical protein
MEPSDFESAADWFAWAFSPEHIVTAMIGAAIGLTTVIALGFLAVRFLSRANERLDEATEPATALGTDWWLCPECHSLNRPSQHCYKGCAMIQGAVLMPRTEDRRSDPTTS